MGKKLYIIKPKNGLCNQLMSISRGIILGIINNRDIIFNGFQLHYKDFDNLCSFEKIIDIEKLQKILNEKNIDIRVYARQDISGIKLQIDNDLDINKTCTAYVSDIFPILNNKINDDHEYLDIGCPISIKIPIEYEHILYYIDNNIKFTHYFIELTNNIKNKLKLSEYVSIHIRLEDDSINFMTEKSNKLTFEEVNIIYQNKYIEELEKLKLLGKKIYACTSLGINKNKNNNFYNIIKKKYNIIDKNDIIEEKSINLFDYLSLNKNNNNNNYREIYGIIDFLIAKESILFIGSDWSSFSIYIYVSHLYNNKQSKLINIFSNLNKEELNKCYIKIKN